MEWLEEVTSDGQKRYQVRRTLPVVHLATLEEKCAYLAQLIREWVQFTVEQFNSSPSDIRVPGMVVDRPFCTSNFFEQYDPFWTSNPLEQYDRVNHRVIPQHEDEWLMGFKYPSDHYPCVTARRIIESIFGSVHNFVGLPFVEYRGDREYCFRFEYLVYCSEHGLEETRRLISERLAEKKRQEEEKRQEEAQKKRERFESLASENIKGFNELSRRMRDAIYTLVGGRDFIAEEPGKVLVDPTNEVAAVITERSIRGSGMGYYEGVAVVYAGITKHQEWLWRHPDDQRQDRPELRVVKIANLRVTTTPSGRKIQVDVINSRLTRTITFEFTNAELGTTSSEDVTSRPEEPVSNSNPSGEFLPHFEKEISRIMEDLRYMWSLKPEQPPIGPAGPGLGKYVSYDQPNLVQKVVGNGDIGAFVVKEQIDHRVWDRQYRLRLYIVKGKKAAEQIACDHAYVSEGGPCLEIIKVSPSSITFKDRDGQKVIPI